MRYHDKTEKTPSLKRTTISLMVGMALSCSVAPVVKAEIAASHVYHNHMPNFWPYYDVSKYDGLAVGAPIRYTYDGQVIELKNNPSSHSSDYTFFLPDGDPMPHDDLTAYYEHPAKPNAYQHWPADTATANNQKHKQSQTHVTMSASVINNVQSFTELPGVAGIPSGYTSGWGDKWRSTQQNVRTTSGYPALDTIHFAGHHTMGPLVGNDFFLKDLIYQNVTLAQPYFLGDSFKSSNGFFPTELGFSERIIPVLTKLGVKWSVLGNVHYSRTLRDYPYLNDPGVDTMVSPPNRADMQNVSEVGEWVSREMVNEKQVTQNKFPFASIPHWVQYVDPETGEQHKVAGIPVEQAGSWAEGYGILGESTAEFLKEYEAAAGDRVMYHVLAHDGDNSQGFAGSIQAWSNSNTIYSQAGVTGKGVDEYLADHPIPEDDVVHVQDGSWIDTRDSSADPTWYHWHIPMGVWKGQMAAFNEVNDTDYVATRQHMVSMEYGFHYLERNFALQQAAENYAKTAEQIWLDDNPSYWSPKTALDNEVTYEGNQLNPWMLSYPVKGDPAKNYAGGANPAELAWYFLIASIDSGFGYYDENIDDGVKPTVSFNQSLFFSTPYVDANLAKDKTGPSIWWPQRYPYNPGSVNISKAEGWAEMYADTKFAIYTYGYDVSGIKDIKVKVRVHKSKWADAKDKTFKLYDPAAHASDPDVNPDNVGEWQTFAMNERDLTPDMNGVDWQPSGKEMFEIVPAQKIGNLYYTYLDQFQEQLLDFYIEATDSKGNVTKSVIQQVYVGAGQYNTEGGKTVEDPNGSIAGSPMFFTDDAVPGNKRPVAHVAATDAGLDLDAIEPGSVVTLTAAGSTDADGTIVSYEWSTGETTKEISVSVEKSTTISVKVKDDVGSSSSASIKLRIVGDDANEVCWKTELASANLHYWNANVDAETSVWPGEKMVDMGNDWYCLELNPEIQTTTVIFTSGDIKISGELPFDDTMPCYENGSFTSFDECSYNSDPIEPENKTPTAVISTDSATKVAKGTVVTLSAENSTDSDGTIASYSWSTGATSETIDVTVNEAQTITLIVTDDQGDTASDTIALSVESQVDENIPPQAKITTSSATTVEKGTVVTLSAESSTDSDGSIASYSWSTGETSETISVTVNEAQTITLTVTDDQGAEAADTIALSVESETNENQAPLAKITTASLTTVPAGTKVKLSAATSTDSDGTIASYSWSTGETSETIDVTVNEAQTITLTVTDNQGATATTTIALNVSGDDPENQMPTAEILALTATKVAAGDTVRLSAKNSSDPDGSNVSYSWSTGETTEEIVVTVNKDITIRLIVTDADGATDIANIKLELEAEPDIIQPTSTKSSGSLGWLVVVSLSLIGVIRRKK